MASRRWLMLTRILVLATLCLGAYAEDSLEDMVKKTDMSNPDQVLTLAQWCTDHDYPTNSRGYYRAVLKLDPDNEAARTAMGYVRSDNGAWKYQNPADSVKAAAAAGGAGDATATGSAPSASQITWDLSLPRDPAPDNDFVNAYIDKLPSLANDSSDMDNAIATLSTDDNFPMALPRLCAALARPSFTDLYAAGMIVQNFSKDGRLNLVRPLLGYMVNATTHVSDADDLACAVFAIGLFKDKRAIPRLIELYNANGDAVKEACGNALAAITALPAPVSKAQAQAWWRKNYAADPHDLFMQQLKNPDPAVELAAADALFDMQEKDIFPVLVKLLAVDDRAINQRALFLIKKMCGLDFNYLESTDPDDRAKRIDMAAKWWKDNGEHFEFPAVPGADNASSAANPAQAPAPAQVASDQYDTWVSQLSAVTGTTADQAEQSLRAAGPAAVNALINGLSSTASIVRSRCNGVLKSTTKQDFEFDALASEADRAKALAAWQAWAAANAPQAAGDSSK